MLTQRANADVLAPDGDPFHVFELRNEQGMRVQITDWGATWLSCQVPVNHQLREVLLGCQLQDYPRQSAYLGASIGRYANRIAHSRFQLGDKLIKLQANQGLHQLHGGAGGFHQRRWQLDNCCSIAQNRGQKSLRFLLFSENGDQGFNGNAQISVTYHLHNDNCLEIIYQGQLDQTGALNLTNHAYFNLDEQHNDVRQHWLQIYSDYYLPVDSEGIPNAPLTSVTNTSFDFRQMKQIGRDFLQGDQCVTKGYDHSFLLNNAQSAVKLYSEKQDLCLTISTSQPAIQIYTGNYLQGIPTRNGSCYQDYNGIALETQCLPDSPNHPEWQKYGGIIKANTDYIQWTKFCFS